MSSSPLRRPPRTVSGRPRRHRPSRGTRGRCPVVRCRCAPERATVTGWVGAGRGRRGRASGEAAARALLRLGAAVTVVDRAASARTAALAAAGAAIALGAAAPPAGTDLLVVSPGWRPDAPLLPRRPAGVEVIGEVELAWRLRGPTRPPWLALTGTNGKTTTVRMLESMLRAGRRSGPSPPATSACRSSTPSPPTGRTTCSPSSCPASSCTRPRPCARPRPRCSTSPRTTSTGTATSTAYAAAKEQIWAGEKAVAIGNADDPRGRRGGWPPRRAGRSRSRWASPGRTSSAWSPARWSTARSATAQLAARPARSARPDRTTSPTRWPRPRSPARTASTPAAVARRPARVHPGPAPQRPGRRRRRGPLRRRQQGDQPARRRWPRSPRTTRSSGSPAGCSRARRSTSWSRRSPAGSRRGAARRRPGRARHGDRATRARASRS